MLPGMGLDQLYLALMDLVEHGAGMAGGRRKLLLLVFGVRLDVR